MVFGKLFSRRATPVPITQDVRSFNAAAINATAASATLPQRPDPFKLHLAQSCSHRLEEYSSHIQDAIESAPVQASDDFDPTRHMRIYVAQDTLFDNSRSPLFDSHASPSSSNYSFMTPMGSYASADNVAFMRGNCATSMGSVSSSPYMSPVFPSAPPEAPSFHRLLDLMFDKLPSAYARSSVKMHPLAYHGSDGRVPILITKVFAISAHDHHFTQYSSDSFVPERSFAYPVVHVSHGNNADNPTNSDKLPQVHGKSYLFAVSALLSFPKDQHHATEFAAANWTSIMRSMDEFLSVVYCKLQYEIHSQSKMFASTLSRSSSSTSSLSSSSSSRNSQLKFKAGSSFSHVRIPKECLFSSDEVRGAASRFATRLKSCLSVPRIKCGSQKWDSWSDVARKTELMVKQPGWLDRVISCFLTMQTQWQKTLGIVDPLIESRGTSVSCRTVVVGENELVRNVIYLLAAFMVPGPAGNLSPSHARYALNSPLDIPNRGPNHALTSTGILTTPNSSVASYISSMWSQQSSVSQLTTSTSAHSEQSGLETALGHVTEDNVADCDFFGSWDDLSPLRDEESSVTQTNSCPNYTTVDGVLEVPLLTRHAEIHVPSLTSICSRSNTAAPVVLDIAGGFHPDFSIQGVDKLNEYALECALIEDANRSRVTLVGDDAPRTVARVIVVQSTGTVIWNLDRQISSDMKTCVQKITKHKFEDKSLGTSNDCGIVNALKLLAEATNNK
ncbi:hypothetical protein V1514DRAFT_352156 [Lipomyces japonicus]|uniref:uncharacterized protein n=1 Tax=Lipomyces japonicus TaxID=56871 RepID=UPI0034CE8E6A